MRRTDWRGWTIRLKDWPVTLYVQDEMPKGHAAWTDDKDKAKGFRKKREAEEFISRLGGIAETVVVEFTPWRRTPQ
jgi:hypothetical protein